MSSSIRSGLTCARRLHCSKAVVREMGLVVNQFQQTSAVTLGCVSAVIHNPDATYGRVPASSPSGVARWTASAGALHCDGETYDELALLAETVLGAQLCLRAFSLELGRPRVR